MSDASVVHKYKIRIGAHDDDIEERIISAAYFTDEGTFTTFKDTAHKAVFAVRSDLMISAERLGDTAC